MEKLRVLIVDDAIFMRKVLKGMFEASGLCEVIGEGTNGVEAVELAKTLQPDVITMDIVMPDLDGLSAAKQILEVCPKTKIIIVSSIGNYKVVIDAIDSGVFDYLVKPLNKEDVNKVINKLTNE